MSADGRGASTGAGVGARELQLVTFGVGREEYAVDILRVREINRLTKITPVPRADPEVEGVINLRGRIVMVVDLARKLRVTGAPRDSNSRVVVAELGGRVLGFIVDRVHEVLRISSEAVEAQPDIAGGAAYLTGVARLGDRLVILLDLDRLFADARSPTT